MKRPSRVAVLAASSALVAVGVGGVVVPTANASNNLTIVIGQGEAGVKIGDTASQVEKAIGRAGFTEHFKRETIWKEFKSFLGVVSFDHQHHVSAMWTANKRLRTNKGIGVASTVAQVVKAYPAAKCTLGTGPGAGPGEESESCLLKTKYRGHVTETAFEWRNKEKSMEEIDIGLV